MSGPVSPPIPILILFDVDGTLVDTAGAGRIAMQRAFVEILGVDAVGKARGTVRFAGMTDPKILEELARVAGISGTRMGRMDGSLRGAYLAHLSEIMATPEPRRRVLPGIATLLRDLERREGVHLGLLTGNLEEGARRKLEPFGLNRYFPGGGFSSDAPERREIARIAREKMQKLAGVAFPADRVTVVGDTEHDVDCARANGFRAVAVVTGWTAREVLEAAGPDALLDDLADPAAALAALGIAGPEDGPR